MQKKELFDGIRDFLMKNNIKKAAIFGSFARNEENEKSDIDILIEGDKLTLFDILNIEDTLQSITQRKIDIVEYQAVKPSLAKHIFSDLIPLI